jgi:3-oxoadipate enol-lactonase
MVLDTPGSGTATRRVVRLRRGDVIGELALLTLETLAEDARGLLQALGITRTHFMGLSRGGMSGQLLALQAPQRLHSLILCDTMSRVPTEAKPLWDERIHTAETRGMEPLVQPTLERWFTAPFREQGHEVIDKVRTMIHTTPTRGYAGGCHAIAARNLTERLKAITVPTLVVVGGTTRERRWLRRV